MHFLRKFAAAVERFNDGVGAILRWLALIMVLMGAYNAVARYATRQVGIALSSNALNELQWYLFSLIFLLGAAYGFRHDVHVRVDVLHQRLGVRGRAWIEILGTALFLLPFSFVMLWVAWPAVRASWAVRETSPDPGGLSRYPIKAAILVCFLLLAFQGVAHLIRQVDVLRGAPDGDGEDVDGDIEGATARGLA
jgi:TRAP-type mannitol/chloroaromatic compound transport system permease small subunit